MALWSSVGFCPLGRIDLRADPDGPITRKLCVKPLEDENASSSSQQRQTRLQSMELSVETGKWSKDLGSLPKPLSSTEIRDSSKGSNVRVAYQGSPGAFSELAALKAYPQSETVPCEQFEVVFKAVELWVVDKAVLPIENTIGGSIHRNYDLLLCHRLHIVGEVQLSVNHCLIALPGVKKENLKRVLSHPQDCPDNITRFLILAREPIIPRCDRPFKTSIVFTLEEGPGMLFKALAVFALRKINLTKIESRPQRNRPLRVVDDLNFGTAKYFDYLFHVDFEASMADPRAQNALSHLQEFVTFLRVLGSYPMDTNPL